jgi:hypothetical protein
MTAKVIPPAEIPSGPPVEPTPDELRDAQLLARKIRDKREEVEVRYRQQLQQLDDCEQDLEAWHRCNEAALEQYRREDARVKR